MKAKKKGQKLVGAVSDGSEQKSTGVVVQNTADMALNKMLRGKPRTPRR